MQVEVANHAVALPCIATTIGVPSREKFDYWHDVVCRNLVDLDYQLIGDTPFEATFRGTSLGAVNVSRIQASPHKVARSSAGISRTNSESLVFNFVLSGHLIGEQDGRSARLNVGDGIFCDAERPYWLHSDEAFEIACIQVPRLTFSKRVSGLHRLTALNFGERGQLCPLVFGYLAHLLDRAPKLGGVMSEKVAQNFTELLVTMLSEVVQGSPLPLSEYRSMALMRVKDLVERHLGNFELDSAMVAAELNLSPRYINQLLEAEDTSLSRYIWQRRLARCAEDLRDVALRGRSVSRIAMDNGFNDLSHFSKAFRQRFGSSPREYRDQRKLPL